MRRPRTFRNLAICDAYRAGSSSKDLASAFGISSVMVLWILRRYGVERRPNPVRRSA